jgi:sulfate adenylyltransferase subunit 1 (EFTu-like GTPase family)
LKSLKLTANAFIPISAYVGDNLVAHTSQMPWYKGPTFLELLDSLEGHRVSSDRALRFPLQDVYKFDKDRILAGRIESGTLSVGDKLLFLPSKKDGVVKSIERWHAPAAKSAAAGESIGIILEDQIFVERGEVAVHAKSPARTGRTFNANVFWLGDKHLEPGRPYIAKLTTQDVECSVKKIRRVINSSTLELIAEDASEIKNREVATVVIRTDKPVVVENFNKMEELGRFVLGREDTSAGGIITELE